MLLPVFPTPEIIGSLRKFGESGPIYKILNFVRPLDDRDWDVCDWLIRIQILESAEEVEYLYSKALLDTAEPHLPYCADASGLETRADTETAKR